MGRTLAAQGVEERTSSAHSRAVSWATWLAAALGTTLGLVLLWLDRGVPERPDTWGFRGFEVVFAATYGTVGAIVINRRPRNLVGWLMVVTGLSAAIQLIVGAYALYGAVVAPGSVAGSDWAAWLYAWMWVPFLTSGGTLLLLVFPSGELLSSRWRWVAAASIVGAVWISATLALTPGPLNNSRNLTNPLDVGALGPIAQSVAPVGFALLVGSLALAAASLVIRYRHSGTETRRQLKWVALAAAILAVVGPLGFVNLQWGSSLFVFAVAGIPVAAGIAVLRYRLYDIDAIINRALVYGLLTAVLAGLYAASTALMQRVFQAVTGASSDAAIVLTTLLVVTAFTPAKDRLQQLVDRRFKERLDARRRLDAFTVRLRDRLWPIDPVLAAERFLHEAVTAFGAQGGAIAVRTPDGSAVERSEGAPVEPRGVVVGAATPEVEARLELSPRADPDDGYSEADADALTAALQALAEAWTSAATIHASASPPVAADVRAESRRDATEDSGEPLTHPGVASRLQS